MIGSLLDPGRATTVHRPTVSVLTPTRLRPERAAFLGELHADLCAAEPGLEWIVVVDGDDPGTPPSTLTADQRTRVIRIGRQIGAAAARNVALGLARAPYVTSVDDDDRLPPGSIADRLHALRTHDVGWVAGRLTELRTDGSAPIPSPVPAGPVAPGEVWRIWGCPCQQFPLGPTTLLVRADLLRGVGGWQGLPQAEDLGMTLSVTGRSAGLMLDRAVYAYRTHAHQMTGSAGFRHLEPLVRHIAYERGRIIAEFRARPQPAPMAV